MYFALMVTLRLEGLTKIVALTHLSVTDGDITEIVW